jgi:hypothetical protein
MERNQMLKCCPLATRFLIGVLLLGAIAFATVFIERNVSVADDAQSKPLRHVVLFKFKESSTPEQVEKVVSEFRALAKKIPTIADFEFGTNNSPEGFNDGLTHCFFVTFKSEKDRDAYLPHPAHKAFVEVLRPHLEKAVVVDYIAGK